MRRLSVVMVRRVLLAGLMLVPITGCGQKKTSDRDLAFVGVADAESMIQARKGVLGIGASGGGVWIDPRSAREFRNGHIPGAVHLPFEDVQTGHLALKDYTVLIVYGDDYNSPVALAMSKALIELRYEDVRTLRGGLRAWEAAGNRLATGEE